MRATLRWALGGALLLTLAVLAFTSEAPAPPSKSLIPPPARARTALVERLGEGPSAASAAAVGSSVKAATSTNVVDVSQWPEALNRQVLSSAARDPFRATPQPSEPLVTAATPPPASAATAIAPVVAPAMNYRYLGQLTDPDGKRLVLIAKADKEITVSRGSLLDDGFSVAEVQANRITIVHVATSTPFEIRIPASDESSR